MTDLDGGNCATRAQALSNRLNGHAVDWHGTVLPISASVGYVEYAPTDTPAEIVQRADELMYLQKNARRDPAGPANLSARVETDHPRVAPVDPAEVVPDPAGPVDRHRPDPHPATLPAHKNGRTPRR